MEFILNDHLKLASSNSGQPTAHTDSDRWS